MKIIKKISTAIDRVLEGMNAISGAVIIFMMVLIGASVLLRYFLGKPIGWSQEISEYCLVFITFLSIAWVLREEGHVSMDLVLQYLKPRTQVLFRIITSAICIVVCFVLAYYAFKVALLEYQLGYTNPSNLAPPKYIFTCAI